MMNIHFFCGTVLVINILIYQGFMIISDSQWLGYYCSMIQFFIPYLSGRYCETKLIELIIIIVPNFVILTLHYLLTSYYDF